MINKIILASRSGVRKKILNENGFECEIIPADIDEVSIKVALLDEGANPTEISKNLAELKSVKISNKIKNKYVLGADSVVDFNGELLSKPKDRNDALDILKKLNGKTHNLVSSVCISFDGAMIWNYTDASSLTMKKLSFDEIKIYLKGIKDKELYAYGVYQIEASGRSLFSKIEGDENAIMGLPIKQIKEYLNLKK
jgi:septum formation protein